MMDEPSWPALVCTRCGADIYIELIDEGSSWSSYRVVDSISCDECGAEWNPKGKPKAVVWLKALAGGEGT